MVEIPIEQMNATVCGVIESYASAQVCVASSATGMGLENGTSRPERTHGAIAHVVGHWNGSVSVVCDEFLASSICNSVFGKGQVDPSEEVLASVVMELTNMIGGHTKGLFDQRAILSVPRVIQVEGWNVLAPESHCVYSSFFAVSFEGEGSAPAIGYAQVELHESTTNLGVSGDYSTRD